MGVRHRKTCIRTINVQAALQSANLTVFRHMAERGELEDTAIAAHAVLFDVWEPDKPMQKGCIRRCPESMAVFRCIETHSPNPRARTAPNPPSKDPGKWEPVAETSVAVAAK